MLIITSLIAYLTACISVRNVLYVKVRMSCCVGGHAYSLPEIGSAPGLTWILRLICANLCQITDRCKIKIQFERLRALHIVLLLTLSVNSVFLRCYLTDILLLFSLPADYSIIWWSSCRPSLATYTLDVCCVHQLQPSFACL